MTNIAASSAAIDKGVRASVTTDLDDEQRPFGTAPDLGADEAAATLHISKCGPTITLPGERITYTLTVSNSGILTATSVVISDALPAWAHHVSGGMLLPGSVVRWTVADLAAGDQAQVQLVVTATQTITNSEYGASCAEGEAATGTQTVVTNVEWKSYLPAVLRQHP